MGKADSGIFWKVLSHLPTKKTQDAFIAFWGKVFELWQIIAADLMERSHDSALKQRPERIYCVRVYLAAHVFLMLVVTNEESAVDAAQAADGAATPTTARSSCVRREPAISRVLVQSR